MSATKIHPTAIVAPGAELGEGVDVGPYCTISAQSKVGDRTRLISHVVLDGIVEVGSDNILHPFCSIGFGPQDLSYRNEPTSVVVGNGNTLRESVTIHRGTARGRGITRVGNNNFLMVGSHAAHDCYLGNNITIANNTALGGHVEVGNFVTIGGVVGIIQHVRIGEYAFIGAGGVLRRDLPPYMCAKDFSEVSGPNLIGLKRNGVPEEDVRIARDLYKALYLGNQTTEKVIAALEAEFSESPFARRFIDFLKATKIGIQR